MTPSNVHLPAIAVWLIDVFVPEKENEPVKGDFSEEFSDLATKLDESTARNWYWKHTMKTIAHLVFRTPWVIATALLGGYFVLMNATNVFMQCVFVPQMYREDIYWGIITSTTLGSLTSSWVLAMIAKRKELVATSLLAWLFVVVTLVSDVIASSFSQPLQVPLLHPIILTVQASLIVVVGLAVWRVRFVRGRRQGAGGR